MIRIGRFRRLSLIWIVFFSSFEDKDARKRTWCVVLRKRAKAELDWRTDGVLERSLGVDEKRRKNFKDEECLVMPEMISQIANTLYTRIAHKSGLVWIAPEVSQNQGPYYCSCIKWVSLIRGRRLKRRLMSKQLHSPSIITHISFTLSPLQKYQCLLFYLVLGPLFLSLIESLGSRWVSHAGFSQWSPRYYIHGHQWQNSRSKPLADTSSNLSFEGVLSR